MKKTAYLGMVAALLVLTVQACTKTNTQPTTQTNPTPNPNPVTPTAHEVKYEIQTIDSLITGIGYINANGDTVEVAPSDFANGSKTITITKTPFRSGLFVHYDNSSPTSPPSLYYLYLSVDGKVVSKDYFTANTFSLGTYISLYTVY